MAWKPHETVELERVSDVSGDEESSGGREDMFGSGDGLEPHEAVELGHISDVSGDEESSGGREDMSSSGDGLEPHEAVELERVSDVNGDGEPSGNREGMSVSSFDGGVETPEERVESLPSDTMRPDWDAALDGLQRVVETGVGAVIAPHLEQLNARINDLGADVLRGSELATNITADMRHVLDGQRELSHCHQQLGTLQTGQEAVLELRQVVQQLQADHSAMRTSQGQAIEILRADLSELRNNHNALLSSIAALSSGQRVIQERLTALGATTQRCPNGWSHRGDRCYLIPPETTTWYRAHRACSLMDPSARLVSVHERNKQHVTAVVAASDCGYIWIGLSRTAENGWGWSDGTELDHTNWSPSEPNNSGGAENCVEIYGRSTLTLKWNDRSCDAKICFMCQINLSN
ncbi:low affinity immunoglobulin epsilon Fc receptor-like [Pollicipes pollicipes]|uniref:low affinity immunoglobulin epsilon Fc receptor-like n=1 Tax=Pollicipes pollicipes TaxID=41117 RepID=UPI0018857731|nr:low affinity immunoglobulin epsilon Fc receptor-like [Pollicipes pollicipes]